MALRIESGALEASGRMGMLSIISRFGGRWRGLWNSGQVWSTVSAST